VWVVGVEELAFCAPLRYLERNFLCHVFAGVLVQ